MIEGRRTLRGFRLTWRQRPLYADDPLAAWQGLLAARNLSEADAFFTPRLADLPDPFAMRDMAKAAGRLAEAIAAGERIHIFGDFDCDGVAGTAVLMEALRAAGAHVSFSIPHRADDGHGIGVAAVKAARAAGCTLGISVDTGTACFDACSKAAQLGLDLIVTDHHLPEGSPEDVLPAAYAVLNPARADCGFAGNCLCGSGVAFFLLMGTWKLLRQQGRAPEFDLKSLLDRVAVATIADVMPLTGVNRILVSHGLQQLNRKPCTGLAALVRIARLKKPLTTTKIGFHLAPRINAAGRMRHGEEAARLLCTESDQEAAVLAQVLDESNRQRRQVEAEVHKQAEARLGDQEVLAVYDADWHAGVVGLAAGRLSRKHGRPAAVGFVAPDGKIRISLRGRPGFHVGELLKECGAHLEAFGGHAGAGGGTLVPERWDDFVRTFGEAVAGQAEVADDHRLLPVDGVLGLAAMHPGLAERLARFEPTGKGNPACTWLLRGVHIAQRRSLKGGVLRLKLSDGGRWLDGVAFAAGALDAALQRGQAADLIGCLQLDEWRGNGAVQFVIEDALAEPLPARGQQEGWE